MNLTIEQGLEYALGGLRNLRYHREHTGPDIQTDMLQILNGLKVAYLSKKADMEPKTVFLRGQELTYTDKTVFLIQVGRGSKGAYSTKYRVTGKIRQACMYYEGINIGNGYKKRFLVEGVKKPYLTDAS